MISTTIPTAHGHLDGTKRPTNSLLKAILTYLLGFVLFAEGYSQEDQTIARIRSDFQKWQPIIDNHLEDCDKIYKYVWGDAYQYETWLNKETENDTLMHSQSVSVIEEKDLGYFVKLATYSFSGDWSIVADYYYTEDRKLFFVFWTLHSFNAPEPVTVEKRLYFDNNGALIRNLKSVYKMNTTEKVDTGFDDRAVDYEWKLDDMGFYKHWAK
jgi:hypothetical protein